MKTRSIVVVGAALGGPVAAARARETDERARIILIERGPHANYSVGGIAQMVSGEMSARKKADAERHAELRDVWNIELRVGLEVTAIDAAGHFVQAGSERLEYSSLIFSAGAASTLPDIDGLAGASNLVAFRTPRDVEGIRVARKGGARRAIVIGGGSMGVEAADALARRGLKTTLVERGPRLLAEFSELMSQIAREGLESLGVTVVTGARIVSAQREGDAIVALAISKRPSLPCDLVVVAAGVTPRSGLLAAAGAATLKNGALVVDAECRTTLKDVFACGSCVALPRFWTEVPTFFPQATSVDRTAQVAGTVAAGGVARMSEPLVGTMIVRAGESVVGRTGLTRAEAAKAIKKNGVGSVITSSAGSDPFVTGDTQVVVELRWDVASGAVIGAEVGGSIGVDKRLDAIAMGLHGVLLTPHSLAEVDLGHAPPFSPVRDPLNVAGTVAAACMDGLVEARAAESLKGARVTLVDVRPPSAKEPGPKGARRIPISELRKRLRELPASRPIVFIDESGRHAFLACRIARGHGRKNAAFVSGGLLAWKACGLPLEKK